MALYTERIPPRSYLSRSFSLIKYRSFQFLICDSPTDNSLSQFIKEFKRLNVTDVVRACEPTYCTDTLLRIGIQVHDLPFKDGSVPQPQLIDKFLSIVEARFNIHSSPSPYSPTSSDEEPDESKPTIAVHCIAGLGRAPLLVAIALITNGMSALDSIEYIRSIRRGAFNSRQIQFIDSYKPRSKRNSLNLNITSASIRQSLGRLFRLKKMEVSAQG